MYEPYCGVIKILSSRRLNYKRYKMVRQTEYKIKLKKIRKKDEVTFHRIVERQKLIKTTCKKYDHQPDQVSGKSFFKEYLEVDVIL
ncbi:hypothetical protein MNBD_DELTA01-30 [hydrothermal vent metagenome]|uniref:Uncharacterized protein n=1 Tax=hydrothermal vent metagenome TaxID=652676 RepID=A0A3B0QQ70_9ZZZZ